MLQTIILVAHVGIALLIIGLVLLQRGKGAEAGTGFGAGASGTVFGARGSATFFSRATGVLAALFFVTSLTLAYLATQRVPAASTLLQAAPATQTAPAPSTPAPTVEAPATSSEPSALSPAVEPAPGDAEQN